MFKGVMTWTFKNDFNMFLEIKKTTKKKPTYSENDSFQPSEMMSF